MNRSDLQKLSRMRIREAGLLLRAGEYSGSYYLAGYAVECALKACIARSIRRFEFPDRERVQKSYSHRLQDLATIANLIPDLIRDGKSNSRLIASWDLVRTWSEQSRYAVWSREESEDMFRAIIRSKDGVLPWIKRHW